MQQAQGEEDTEAQLQLGRVLQRQIERSALVTEDIERQAYGTWHRYPWKPEVEPTGDPNLPEGKGKDVGDQQEQDILPAGSGPADPHGQRALPRRAIGIDVAQVVDHQDVRAEQPHRRPRPAARVKVTSAVCR